MSKSLATKQDANHCQDKRQRDCWLLIHYMFAGFPFSVDSACIKYLPQMKTDWSAKRKKTQAWNPRIVSAYRFSLSTCCTPLKQVNGLIKLVTGCYKSFFLKSFISSKAKPDAQKQPKAATAKLNRSHKSNSLRAEIELITDAQACH